MINKHNIFLTVCKKTILDRLMYNIMKEQQLLFGNPDSDRKWMNI